MTNLKRIILIFIATIIAIFAYQIPSDAASFSVSANKTTLTVGDSATLNINISDCLGKFTVSTTDSSVVSVSDTLLDVDPNGSVTFTR